MVTFCAFLCVGLIPLLPFTIMPLFGMGTDRQFTASAGMTAIAFFGIGTLKSYFVASNWLRAGLETLVMGGGAAALAYAVGALLKGLA